jgi:hypothetical protein
VLSTFDDYFIDKYMLMGPPIDLTALMDKGHGKNEQEVDGGDEVSMKSKAFIRVREFDLGENDEYNEAGTMTNMQHAQLSIRAKSRRNRKTDMKAKHKADTSDNEGNQSYNTSISNNETSYIGFFQPGVPRWISAEDMKEAANGIEERKDDCANQSNQLCPEDKANQGRQRST